MTENLGNKKERPKKSGLPILFILSLFGLAMSFIGGACFYRSIGINLIIDLLSLLRFVSLWLSLIIFVVSAFSFFNFLFRLKWRKILFCTLIGIVALFSIALVMPTMGRFPPKFIKEQCAKDMSEIGGTLMAYAENNEGKYPHTDWCDVVVGTYELKPRTLSCMGVCINRIEGESSYALNENIIGLETSELPPDMVILFETDYFGDDPDKKVDAIFRITGKSFKEKRFVREGAWNQVGDIEILTCDHHAGLGCNILFADGHIEFVKKKDLPNLRWKP